MRFYSMSDADIHALPLQPAAGNVGKILPAISPAALPQIKNFIVKDGRIIIKTIVDGIEYKRVFKLTSKKPIDSATIQKMYAKVLTQLGEMEGRDLTSQALKPVEAPHQFKIPRVLGQKFVLKTEKGNATFQRIETPASTVATLPTTPKTETAPITNLSEQRKAFVSDLDAKANTPEIRSQALAQFDVYERLVSHLTQKGYSQDEVNKALDKITTQGHLRLLTALGGRAYPFGDERTIGDLLQEPGSEFIRGLVLSMKSPSKDKGLFAEMGAKAPSTRFQAIAKMFKRDKTKKCQTDITNFLLNERVRNPLVFTGRDGSAYVMSYSKGVSKGVSAGLSSILKPAATKADDIPLINSGAFLVRDKAWSGASATPGKTPPAMNGHPANLRSVKVIGPDGKSEVLTAASSRTDSLELMQEAVMTAAVDHSEADIPHGFTKTKEGEYEFQHVITSFMDFSKAKSFKRHFGSEDERTYLENMKKAYDKWPPEGYKVKMRIPGEKEPVIVTLKRPIILHQEFNVNLSWPSLGRIEESRNFNFIGNNRLFSEFIKKTNISPSAELIKTSRFMAAELCNVMEGSSKNFEKYLIKGEMIDFEKLDLEKIHNSKIFERPAYQDYQKALAKFLVEARMSTEVDLGTARQEEDKENIKKLESQLQATAAVFSVLFYKAPPDTTSSDFHFPTWQFNPKVKKSEELHAADLELLRNNLCDYVGGQGLSIGKQCKVGVERTGTAVALRVGAKRYEREMSEVFVPILGKPEGAELKKLLVMKKFNREAMFGHAVHVPIESRGKSGLKLDEAGPLGLNPVVYKYLYSEEDIAHLWQIDQSISAYPDVVNLTYEQLAAKGTTQYDGKLIYKEALIGQTKGAVKKKVSEDDRQAVDEQLKALFKTLGINLEKPIVNRGLQLDIPIGDLRLNEIVGADGKTRLELLQDKIKTETDPKTDPKVKYVLQSIINLGLRAEDVRSFQEFLTSRTVAPSVPAAPVIQAPPAALDLDAQFKKIFSKPSPPAEPLTAAIIAMDEDLEELPDFEDASAPAAKTVDPAKREQIEKQALQDLVSKLENGFKVVDPVTSEETPLRDLLIRNNAVLIDTEKLFVQIVSELALPSVGAAQKEALIDFCIAWVDANRNTGEFAKAEKILERISSREPRLEQCMKTKPPLPQTLSFEPAENPVDRIFADVRAHALHPIPEPPPAHMMAALGEDRYTSAVNGLADDLTKMQSQLYSQLTPGDLSINLDGGMSKQAEKFYLLGEKITGYFESQLQKATPEEKKNLIKFILDVEKRCYANKDFATAAAIHKVLAKTELDALRTSVISDFNEQGRWTALDELFDPTNQYENLKAKYQSIGGPHIPYIEPLVAEINEQAEEVTLTSTGFTFEALKAIHILQQQCDGRALPPIDKPLTTDISRELGMSAPPVVVAPAIAVSVEKAASELAFEKAQTMAQEIDASLTHITAELPEGEKARFCFKARQELTALESFLKANSIEPGKQGEIQGKINVLAEKIVTLVTNIKTEEERGILAFQEELSKELVRSLCLPDYASSKVEVMLKAQDRVAALLRSDPVLSEMVEKYKTEFSLEKSLERIKELRGFADASTDVMVKAQNLIGIEKLTSKLLANKQIEPNHEVLEQNKKLKEQVIEGMLKRADQSSGVEPSIVHLQMEQLAPDIRIAIINGMAAKITPDEITKAQLEKMIIGERGVWKSFRERISPTAKNQEKQLERIQKILPRIVQSIPKKALKGLLKSVEYEEPSVVDTKMKKVFKRLPDRLLIRQEAIYSKNQLLDLALTLPPKECAATMATLSKTLKPSEVINALEKLNPVEMLEIVKHLPEDLLMALDKTGFSLLHRVCFDRNFEKVALAIINKLSREKLQDLVDHEGGKIGDYTIDAFKQGHFAVAKALLTNLRTPATLLGDVSQGIAGLMTKLLNSDTTPTFEVILEWIKELPPGDMAELAAKLPKRFLLTQDKTGLPLLDFVCLNPANAKVALALLNRFSQEDLQTLKRTDGTEKLLPSYMLETYKARNFEVFTAFVSKFGLSSKALINVIDQINLQDLPKLLKLDGGEYVNNDTLFHYACENGMAVVVNKIMEMLPQDQLLKLLSMQDSKGNTPSQLAYHDLAYNMLEILNAKEPVPVVESEPELPEVEVPADISEPVVVELTPEQIVEHLRVLDPKNREKEFNNLSSAQRSELQRHLIAAHSTPDQPSIIPEISGLLTDAAKRDSANKAVIDQLLELGKPLSHEVGIEGRAAQVKEKEQFEGALILSSTSLTPTKPLFEEISSQLKKIQEELINEATPADKKVALERDAVTLLGFCEKWLKENSKTPEFEKAKISLAAVIEMYRKEELKQLLGRPFTYAQVIAGLSAAETYKPAVASIASGSEKLGAILTELRETRFGSQRFGSQEEYNKKISLLANDLEKAQKRLFGQLDPSDLVQSNWPVNKLNAGKEFAEFADKISMHFSNSIFLEKDADKQERLMKFLINLATKSLENGDFASAGAIFNALNRPEIRGLKDKEGTSILDDKVLHEPKALHDDYRAPFSALETLFTDPVKLKVQYKAFAGPTGKPYVPYVKTYLDQTQTESQKLPTLNVDGQYNIKKAEVFQETISECLSPQKGIKAEAIPQQAESDLLAEINKVQVPARTASYADKAVVEYARKEYIAILNNIESAKTKNEKEKWAHYFEARQKKTDLGKLLQQYPDNTELRNLLKEMNPILSNALNKAWADNPALTALTVDKTPMKDKIIAGNFFGVKPYRLRRILGDLIAMSMYSTKKEARSTALQDINSIMKACADEPDLFNEVMHGNLAKKLDKDIKPKDVKEALKKAEQDIVNAAIFRSMLDQFMIYHSDSAEGLTEFMKKVINPSATTTLKEDLKELAELISKPGLLQIQSYDTTDLLKRSAFQLLHNRMLKDPSKVAQELSAAKDAFSSNPDLLKLTPEEDAVLKLKSELRGEMVAGKAEIIQRIILKLMLQGKRENEIMPAYNMLKASHATTPAIEECVTGVLSTLYASTKTNPKPTLLLYSEVYKNFTAQYQMVESLSKIYKEAFKGKEDTPSAREFNSVLKELKDESENMLNFFQEGLPKAALEELDILESQLIDPKINGNEKARLSREFFGKHEAQLSNIINETSKFKFAENGEALLKLRLCTAELAQSLKEVSPDLSDALKSFFKEQLSTEYPKDKVLSQEEAKAGLTSVARPIVELGTRPELIYIDVLKSVPDEKDGHPNSDKKALLTKFREISLQAFTLNLTILV
jgi:hypothetical protein